MTDISYISAIIWEINPSVSTVHVIALLRKSTATDFLQKVREKRASECFPGGCSTEVSEAGELIETYVSSQSVVLCICSPVSYFRGNYFTVCSTTFI